MGQFLIGSVNWGPGEVAICAAGGLSDNLWSGDLAIGVTDHLKSNLEKHLVIFGDIATSASGFESAIGATNHFQKTCNFESDIATSATDYLLSLNRGNESSIYFLDVSM
jgi:hypothetical protein